MPKAEKGSLKDIGKRMKMKGLQKLKFYCQICEKQCRDSNGFKCHLTSEHHLQQMKIFSSNATNIMDQYSKSFEKYFLDTLRMRHSTSRVAANTVYQEMIQDKTHIHMNATIWTTLTDFVKYLGKTKQCIVDETERGWYVTYIERNVYKLIQNETTQRRMDAEIQAEYETNQRIEQQRIAAAIAYDRAHRFDGTSSSNGGITDGPTKILRKDNDNHDINNHDDITTTPSIPTIQLDIKKKGKKLMKTTPMETGKSVFDDDDDDDDDENDDDDDDDDDDENIDTTLLSSTLPIHHPQQDKQQMKSKKTKDSDNNQNTINDDHPQRDAKLQNTDNRNDNDNNNDNNNNNNNDTPWLYPNIIVRIINQSLFNGLYYRKKGVVIKVIDQYIGQVQLLNDNNVSSSSSTTANTNSKTIIQFDQDDLETVIPKSISSNESSSSSTTTEEYIRILRGKYKGYYGTLQSMDKKKCIATIHVINNIPTTSTTTKYTTSTEDQNNIITTLSKVSFDDFSKVYIPST